MRKRIMYILTGALLAAGPANAGPLTNVFLDSLKGQGEASWGEGYQQGRTETLKGVVLRMADGRRFDIETLELDYSGSSYIMKAGNIRMNPQENVLLLKADAVTFSGNKSYLSSFWSLGMVDDLCEMIGPESRIVVEDFGMILSGRETVLVEDSKYRVQHLELGNLVKGTKENCKSSISFSMSGYEAIMPDGSSTRAQDIDLALNIPGSLSSLAQDSAQIVSISVDAKRATSLISGGATAWAVDDGSFSAYFSALGLVRPLTLTLKYADLPKDTGYWMRLWNAMGDLRGGVELDLQGVTLRSANVLPPQSVTKFTDAGLSTVLLDTSLKIEIAGGLIDVSSDLQATGLMASTLQANLKMNDYPALAIARHADNPDRFDYVLPVYVNELNYGQTDDGIVDAAASIMGVPVTVRISQIREELNRDNPNVETVMRSLATYAANFATLTYRDAPARVALSIKEDLDLREAMIISSKLPSDILKIFDFTISSGAQE